MYQTKNYIYKDFDRTQKNAVCNYIRALVKQNLELSLADIYDKFIADEKYYIELNASRFPFLADVIDEAWFADDTRKYIQACITYYQYKERQKPIIEAQKQYEKNKRKFLQEVKMSKEQPTKKQLYYYDKLCKRYSIVKKDVSQLSKLDMKNEIESILNEYSNDYTNAD